MSDQTHGRDHPREEGADGPNPFSREGAAGAWALPDPAAAGVPAARPTDERPQAPPAVPPVPPSGFPPAASNRPFRYGYEGGDHPQANAALVTGIVGLVLGLAFGVGGLVGIVGVVLGQRAKRAIDGDPARWTGRGKAHAGVVLGIMGLVALALWVGLFLVVAVLGA